MKRTISLIIAIVMVLSMSSMAVFAEATTGSITINGVSEENVYEIYQLLILESYDITSGAYSYKINPSWSAFFGAAEAKQYVSIDDAGYVTWIGGEDDDSVATFAKLALAYAKANGIAPVQSSANDGEFVITTGADGKKSGKFANLPLGYYLVDSTMGALCGLTTTNPDASINAKNGTPTIDKQVQEDATGQWGDNNTADIGQIVYFRVTINVHAGAENYIMHDLMSAGLTFDKVTKVEHIRPGSETKDAVANTDYTVHSDVQVNADPENGIEAHNCTFEVRFSQEFCDQLETNDKIVVYYQAMLNRNAIVAGEGNSNTAQLEYGEEHFTTTDTTTTKTYGFDLIKTDSQNQLIDGAGFRIYDAATGGNEIKVVLMDDGVTYRRARENEEGVVLMVTNGQVRVVGFDNGTYYLEEVVTPAGYNQLTARQKFIISDGNLDATFNDGIFSTGSGVHVVNKTGSMLPETGGMGTVLFITIGTLVVLGAGVLLVTKKRMGMIEE